MAIQRNFLVDILNNYEVIIETGCWIYKGEIDSGTGYGRVLINGRRYHVHRLSAFFNLGLNLENSKEFACHIQECSNRSCINPNHLYIGDNKSNQLDVIKDKCKKGHDLIGENIRLSLRKNGNFFRQCKICERLRYEIKKEVMQNVISLLKKEG